MTKTSLDKGKIKILLLEGVHSSAVEAFRRDGYTNIEEHPKSLPEAKLAASLRDAYIIGIRSATQLPAETFASVPRLIGIGCFCIGTNQVDLDAATQRGKCLGIVGYGHTGTQIGLLAEALGMQVIYYDIETKLALGNARAVPSLDVLLETADLVTLHVPETPQTHRMIGAVQLARMKKGAHLVNASRGTVVDIDALVDALKSRHLTGAGMDVFPVEPKTASDEFVSPLRGMDNVLLTPHVGGSTEEALPEHPGKHRLQHIHCNQPGVLSAINAVFSGEKINIAGQYLQRGRSLARLDIPGTIRTRIL